MFNLSSITIINNKYIYDSYCTNNLEPNDKCKCLAFGMIKNHILKNLNKKLLPFLKIPDEFYHITSNDKHQNTSIYL